jgi:hypothetical protein
MRLLSQFVLPVNEFKDTACKIINNAFGNPPHVHTQFNVTGSVGNFFLYQGCLLSLFPPVILPILMSVG